MNGSETNEASKRREMRPLLAFGGIAAALLAFAQLASEVGEGETHGFDRVVLLALRVPGDASQAIGPHWLPGAMLDLTSLGSVPVLTLVTLAALGFLLVSRRHATALLVAAAVAGGGLLSMALKLLFARPRPDLVAHLAQVHSLSFPSGHALSSAATYLTLAALLARTQKSRAVRAYLMTTALTLVLVVGLTRVYLGVHWPTDVLAGWTLGAAWAALCWTVAGLLQRRGQIETAA